MACDIGYTLEQLQKLEELFAQCKYPNREQREKWSTDLGLDPDKIKCWFKNRVLLLKIEETRQENDNLRTENAILQWENTMMSKKLESRPKCFKCSSSEAHEDLLRENAELKEERQRVTNLVMDILQNPALLHEEIRGLDVDLDLRLAPPSSPTSNGEFDD